MKILNSLCLFLVFSFSIPAFAHNCLVREREHLSSGPAGGAACSIVQSPELVEGLFTFPYLGTRSCRVRYWKAEAVQVQLYRHSYVTRIFDRCRGWLVDKDYSSEVTSSSVSFKIANPNLDEKIEDEAKLLPVSREEMEVLWQKTLDRCGYRP